MENFEGQITDVKPYDKGKKGPMYFLDAVDSHGKDMSFSGMGTCPADIGTHVKISYKINESGEKTYNNIKNITKCAQANISVESKEEVSNEKTPKQKATREEIDALEDEALKLCAARAKKKMKACYDTVKEILGQEPVGDEIRMVNCLFIDMKSSVRAMAIKLASDKLR